MRTFLCSLFKGCSILSQGFRKVYGIKLSRVNKIHYQFYPASLFFPIQIVIVKRLTLKSNCQGSCKFSSHLIILMMLGENLFCGINRSSLFPLVVWICIQIPWAQPYVPQWKWRLKWNWGWYRLVVTLEYFHDVYLNICPSPLQKGKHDNPKLSCLMVQGTTRLVA